MILILLQMTMLSTVWRGISHVTLAWDPLSQQEPSVPQVKKEGYIHSQCKWPNQKSRGAASAT